MPRLQRKKPKMKLSRRILGGIGDAVKWASPAAGFIPGIGTAVGAGLGAVGGALGTVNDRDEYGNIRDLSWGRAGKSGLGYGLYGGLGAYGVGKLAGAAKAAGGWKTAAGRRAALGQAGKAGQALTGAKNRNRAGDILDWIKENPSVILGGLSAYTGAKEGARRDGLNRELLDMARARASEGAPMREAARQALLGGIQPRRLDAEFADPSNPFYRRAS